MLCRLLLFLLLSPDAVLKMQTKLKEELIYVLPSHLLVCSANDENRPLNANFILVLRIWHIVFSMKRKWHGEGFIVTLVSVLLNFYLLLQHISTSTLGLLVPSE